MNATTMPSNLASQVSPIERELVRLRIAQELRKRLDLAIELLALGQLTSSEALDLIQSKTAEEYITRVQEEEKERKLQILLLTNIEGIDILLAEDLIDEFGSLEAITKATPKELEMVPGIDKSKARLIVRELPKLVR